MGQSRPVLSTLGMRAQVVARAERDAPADALMYLVILVIMRAVTSST